MKTINSDPKTAKKLSYQFTGLERVGSVAAQTQTGVTGGLDAGAGSS